MASASVCVSRGSCSCLLPLGEALQDQQVGMTQAPFKLLPLCWILEHARFCMHPLRAESLFPTALQLSHMQVPLAFKARHSGVVCLVQDLQAEEPDVGLGPLALWGELLQL